MQANLGQEQLARALAQAWTSGGLIPLPPAQDAPRTRAEAYAIQDRMAALIGGRAVGWKVGASVPAVQRFEGHDGPIPGRIFADRCFETSASAPAALYSGAKVECEFAFCLTRDLPPGAGPITAAGLAPALAFHPAIELSATRFAPGTGGRAMGTYDGIADNGTGGAAVLGAAVSDWRALDFAAMEIEARIDDSPPLQAYSGPYRRDPVEIMAETLTDLRARGVALEAGLCVLTGSATLPTPLRRGQTLTARFAGFPPLTLSLT